MLSSGVAGVDLAFIDGQHLFDYALRDFYNVERYCHPGSAVLMHDCLPRDEARATRQPSRKWAGDTWKAVHFLIEERPDLRVRLSNVRPTGLAIITGFRAGASPDEPSSSKIAAYGALTWDTYLQEMAGSTRVVGSSWEAIEPVLSHARWVAGA